MTTAKAKAASKAKPKTEPAVVAAADVEKVEDVNLDELDALLAEEGLSDAGDAAVILDDDVEDLDEVIEKMEKREAAYEDQEEDVVAAPASEDATTDEEKAAALLASKEKAYAKEPAKTAKAPAKKTKEAKEKKSAAPRATGLVGSAAIKAKLGEKVKDFMIFRPEDADLKGKLLEGKINNNLELIDTLPKKVQETAVNVMDHIAFGRALSCYTVQALEVLKEGKTITNKDIVAKYLKHPYSIGTANSQAGQMMKLLPALGIAARAGQSLTLNPDSTLLPYLS